jgi:hypothetical protein
MIRERDLAAACGFLWTVIGRIADECFDNDQQPDWLRSIMVRYEVGLGKADKMLEQWAKEHPDVDLSAESAQYDEE